MPSVTVPWAVKLATLNPLTASVLSNWITPAAAFMSSGPLSMITWPPTLTISPAARAFEAAREQAKISPSASTLDDRVTSEHMMTSSLSLPGHAQEWSIQASRRNGPEQIDRRAPSRWRSERRLAWQSP